MEVDDDAAVEIVVDDVDDVILGLEDLRESSTRDVEKEMLLLLLRLPLRPLLLLLLLPLRPLLLSLSPKPPFGERTSGKRRGEKKTRCCCWFCVWREEVLEGEAQLEKANDNLER